MSERNRSVPVAVVGIGCRFPGGVDSPEAFWRLLERGEAAMGPMPAGRFDVERFVHPEPRMSGKMVTAEGGFLERVDEFDAEFFGISPREATKIDPQHRLLLELSWEALEDAAIAPSTLRGTRSGVYMGLWSGEYEAVMSRRLDEIDLYATTGGGRYAAAGRVSYALDLRGPSMTLDTACSSSLVAIHLGCQALRSGDADVVLAGAANLILQPYVSIGYSRSGMLSPGARCRFGAPTPDGYVRSEGAGVVVLKPLEAALRDGDTVHAVILGSSVNSDGKGSGSLVAPSEEAQAEMLRTAYRQASVAPERVAYVEAHGTGTAAGDRVELGALGSVLGRRSPGPLAVGSIKTLIGHTEAASGLAGLIKAILVLRNRRLPAESGGAERNPEIAWDRLGVEIPGGAMDLEPNGAPLVAGVNSFGVTGTNAHIILEEAPTPSDRAEGRGGEAVRPSIIALSGRSEAALRQAASALRNRVQAPGDIAIEDISYTLTRGRDHHPHRLAAVVESMEELREVLAEVESDEASGRIARGVAPEVEQPRVAFVFSGQGSQWLGMGRELMASCPAFAETIAEAGRVLEPMVEWSLEKVLAGDQPMDSIDVIQPVLAVVQMALGRQLNAWGVVPDAVLGHSMGEVPAAYAAGALTLEEALRVLVVRSRLLAEIAGRGAMALADEEPGRVEERVARFGERLAVAAVNGPRSTVVSGDPEAVDEFVAELEAEGTFCRRVRVDVASHSAQTEPLLGRLMDELGDLRPQAGPVAFHSTVLAEAVTGDRLGADYWASNLRRPVRLHETVRSMVEGGVDVFVEIAPHPVLLSSLADIAADVGVRPTLLPLLRREEPETKRLLEAASRLHVAGVQLDWSALAAPGARPVRLPSYPWQRESYWLEHWEDWSGQEDRAASGPSRPAEADQALYRVAWEPLPAERGEDVDPAGSSWTILGDRGGVAERLAGLLRDRGCDVALVTDGAPVPGELARTTRAGLVDLRPMDAAAGEADPSPELGLERACGGPLSVVQGLVSDGAELPGGLWLVTRGAQGTPTRAPEPAAAPQAALWGLGRTLWREHPELDPHLVDVDPAASVDEQAGIVLSALTSAEPQLAFSGGTAHAARLVRAPEEAARTPAQWRPDASYLLTGGMGDLGLSVAEEMVRGGARRLVLAGRTPLPPRAEWADPSLDASTRRRVDGVLALERLGASVHVLSVDVGDAEALARALDRYRAERWPEIAGVVHLAGTLNNQLVRDLSRDEFLEVMRGKAQGAWNLHRLLPDAERMVFFSSLVPTLPQAGQANYAAANAFVDSLAWARNNAGAPTVSLAWGVWKGSGMVRDQRVARSVDLMEEGGLQSLDPALGRQLFHWTAASAEPHLVIGMVDWAKAAKTIERRPGARFYAELLSGVEVEEGAGRFGEELRDLPVAQRRPAVLDRLRVLASQVLGIGVESLAFDQPLGRRGLDSLMAMEFRNRVETDLDMRLPASAVWNYPTLQALADHLLEKLEGSRVDEPAVAAGASAMGEGDIAALVTEVADTSEEDVLRMLREDS